MGEKRYVQHISGQGEKYHVANEHPHTWVASADCNVTYDLPKSEYRLCDPPEKWVDVTERIQESGYSKQCWFDNPNEKNVIDEIRSGYRLRKVRVNPDYKDNPVQWAFIVEQRSS